MKISLNLNDRELLALEEISRKMDLPKEKVLIQALRTYQAITLGHCELKKINPLSKINPEIISFPEED